MTPQEEALNSQLPGLDIIKDLQNTDQEIIDDLEEIKEGQAKINEKVDLGFAKGKDRMDGLEKMFENHITTTEGNHKEAMGAYTDLKTEIKDNKFKDVTQELTKKNEEIKQIKEKFFGAVKMVFNTALSIVAGGLVVYLFK